MTSLMKKTVIAGVIAAFPLSASADAIAVGLAANLDSGSVTNFASAAGSGGSAAASASSGASTSTASAAASTEFNPLSASAAGNLAGDHWSSAAVASQVPDIETQIAAWVCENWEAGSGDVDGVTDDVSSVGTFDLGAPFGTVIVTHDPHSHTVSGSAEVGDFDISC